MNSIRHSAIIIRNLVIPVVIIIVLSFCFITLALIVVTRSFNSEEVEAKKYIIQSMLDAEESNLAHILTSYSYWDDAIGNIITKLDKKWVDINIIKDLKNLYSINLFVSLSGDDKIIYATYNHKEINTTLQELIPGIEYIIKRIRNERINVNNITSYTSFARINDAIMIFALRPMLSDIKPSYDIDPKTIPIMIIARTVDSSLLQHISINGMIKNLSVTKEYPINGEFIILNMVNKDQFFLTFSPDQPGYAMIYKLMPLTVTILLINVICVYLFWRTAVKADLILNISREEEQHALKREQALAKKITKDANRFLIDMSHELKTSLNAVIGFTRLIYSDKSSLNTEQQENVEHLKNTSEHLLQFLKSLLDITRIKEKKVDLVLELVNPYELVKECIDFVKGLSANVGVKIEIIFISQYNYILADAFRLKQVIINLLSNAIKYNTANGKVEVILSRHDSKIRISIKDTGIGISQENIDNVFQPFTRFGVKKDKVEGSGIGLTLCKSLVELMQGEIGVISDLGVGTTFWVEFHEIEIIEQDPEGVLYTQKVRINNLIKDTIDVLYIDDDERNIMLITKYFGFISDRIKLHIISNVNEIKDTVDLAPCMIIIDLDVETMQRDEILPSLRKQKSIQTTPAIGISSYIFHDAIDHLYAAGYTEVIIKPIKLSQLMDAIIKVLS